MATTEVSRKRIVSTIDVVSARLGDDKTLSPGGLDVECRVMMLAAPQPNQVFAAKRCPYPPLCSFFAIAKASLGSRSSQPEGR